MTNNKKNINISIYGDNTLKTFNENIAKESQEIMEEFAYLIEDVFEKSDVVSAATSILDELQDMAEKVAMIQAKDVMPLLDSITTAFGPEVAQRFNSVTSEQTTQLVSQIQAAKTAIDAEVNRMKAGVEGGDMSDMGMMGNDDGAPVESPQEAPEANLPDMPIDNNKGDDEAMHGHGSNNFAGRARKESAKIRGKIIETETEETPEFLKSEIARYTRLGNEARNQVVSAKPPEYYFSKADEFREKLKLKLKEGTKFKV